MEPVIISSTLRANIVSTKRDYYEVLSTSRDADAAELKRAYRKLALELHPDRNPGDPEAEAKFKEASEAYQVLSDPEKRALYDRFGHEGPRGSGFGGGFSNMGDIFSAFGDIFGDIFGMSGFGGGGRASARGADLETHVNLTLAEVAKGVNREISYQRRIVCTDCAGSGAAPGQSREQCGMCRGHGQVMHQQGFMMITTTCPTCRGQGEVIRKPCASCKGTGLIAAKETLQITIPAGVDDGSTLRLAGRGEFAPGGGSAGNLYVTLQVVEDPRFEREGADLHTLLPISFPQAVMGATLMAPMVEGETEVTIPPGSQPGDTIVLRGKGLPRLQAKGAGELVVHLKLVVPKRLNNEQLEALHAFSQAGGDEVDTSPAEKHSFWRRKKK